MHSSHWLQSTLKHEFLPIMSGAVCEHLKEYTTHISRVRSTFTPESILVCDCRHCTNLLQQLSHYKVQSQVNLNHQDLVIHPVQAVYKTHWKFQTDVYQKYVIACFYPMSNNCLRKYEQPSPGLLSCQSSCRMCSNDSCLWGRLIQG